MSNLNNKLQAPIIEGSATVSNHVDGSRNHLDSLLESMNQIEILESGITIPTITLVNLVFFRIL